MDEQTPTSRQLIVLALVVEGGMGLVAFGLARWLDRPLLLPWDWSVASIGWGALAGLPPLVILFLALRLPLRPLEALVRILEEQIIPMFRPCGLPALAVISALAGLGEEMLFRGVVQQSIGDWVGGWTGDALGSWIGIAAAALLFGLLHPITTTYAVLAGLIGFYLGVLFAASGNLLIPIAAHAVYDFLALVYLVKLRIAPSRTGGISQDP